MRPDIPQVKPSDGQRRAARHLLRAARAATLATTLPDGGAPYASLVTMATDHDGSPILLLSALAEHTRALETDPRCALLVHEAGNLPNPQTGPRATVLARAERVADGALRDRLAGRFLARHPGARLYVGFGDFAIWRLTVERVHFVGGFARAVWLDDGVILPADHAEAFARAEPDVIAHMNQDHAAAVSSYACGLLGLEDGPWRLCAIDADGLDLGLAVGEEENATVPPRVHRLPFDPPVESPDGLRPRLVALARQAREAASGLG